MRTALTYDDVLLVPQYSEIRSRTEVNLVSDLDSKRSGNKIAGFENAAIIGYKEIWDCVDRLNDLENINQIPDDFHDGEFGFSEYLSHDGVGIRFDYFHKDYQAWIEMNHLHAETILKLAKSVDLPLYHIETIMHETARIQLGETIPLADLSGKYTISQKINLE